MFGYPQFPNKFHTHPPKPTEAELIFIRVSLPPANFLEHLGQNASAAPQTFTHSSLLFTLD